MSAAVLGGVGGLRTNLSFEDPEVDLAADAGEGNKAAGDVGRGGGVGGGGGGMGGDVAAAEDAGGGCGTEGVVLVESCDTGCRNGEQYSGK